MGILLRHFAIRLELVWMHKDHLWTNAFPNWSQQLSPELFSVCSVVWFWKDLLLFRFTWIFYWTHPTWLLCVSCIRMDEISRLLGSVGRSRSDTVSSDATQSTGTRLALRHRLSQLMTCMDDLELKNELHEKMVETLDGAFLACSKMANKAKKSIFRWRENQSSESWHEFWRPNVLFTWFYELNVCWSVNVFLIGSNWALPGCFCWAACMLWWKISG